MGLQNVLFGAPYLPNPSPTPKIYLMSTRNSKIRNPKMAILATHFLLTHHTPAHLLIEYLNNLEPDNWNPKHWEPPKTTLGTTKKCYFNNLFPPYSPNPSPTPKI